MTNHDESSPVAATLRREGLRPRKGLGQNFLRDRSYAARIVDAAEVGRGDTVVEVGPGTGALTHLLAARAGCLTAVELDPHLVAVLQREFGANSRVQIWEGDALHFDPCTHVSGPYTLVGNIPYYITGQILRHFLESHCPPARAVLMVQREVADRVVARPGEMSLLSVSVQAYGEARIAVRVPRGAFYPVPKVDSAVLVIKPHPEPIFGRDPDSFFTVARAGFGTRRKQLANALALNLHIPTASARDILTSAGIEPSRRAETLSLPEWKRLADVWREGAA